MPPMAVPVVLFFPGPAQVRGKKREEEEEKRNAPWKTR
jgi:hypothetical protein